jgi:hypothetical protein
MMNNAVNSRNGVKRITFLPLSASVLPIKAEDKNMKAIDLSSRHVNSDALYWKIFKAV